MRRSGRSMNRKDRDRGAEMRLTERTSKLIPETRRVVPKGAIGKVKATLLGRIHEVTHQGTARGRAKCDIYDCLIEKVHRR